MSLYRPDGLVADLGGGRLQLAVCSQRSVRVLFAPNDGPVPAPSLAVVHPCQGFRDFAVGPAAPATPPARAAGRPAVRSGSLWSQVAEAIDYTFLYGPDLDEVIASYRQLTGAAPLFGRWAYGVWQCRERYKTQEELVGVVREFRRRRIPLDAILQDWFYWDPFKWGSHRFDRERHPDPEGMTRDLHAMKAKLMISVWAKFVPGSDNHTEPC